MIRKFSFFRIDMTCLGTAALFGLAAPPAAPAGILFNTTTNLAVNGAPAKFIFATEDGTGLGNAQPGLGQALASDRSRATAVSRIILQFSCDVLLQREESTVNRERKDSDSSELPTKNKATREFKATY